MVFVTLAPSQREIAHQALSDLQKELGINSKGGRWFHARNDSHKTRSKMLKMVDNLDLHAVVISEDHCSQAQEANRRKKCLTKWAEGLDQHKSYDLSLDREDSREKDDQTVLVNLRNSLGLSLKFKHDRDSDRTQLIALADFVAWTYSSPKTGWREKIQEAVDIEVI